MTAKRQDADAAPARPAARRLKFGRGGRRMVVAGVIVAVTLGGAYAVWRQVRAHVLAGDQYKIEPANILMSPAPPWIRSDIKSEVIREASFDSPLSLLDARLTVRVASAFAAHPWIARVERVSKRFPSGMEVVVTYRRPVAMVEVPDGALPVDVEGVVLPTVDFQPGEADRYPRIGEIHTQPAGLVGTRWGDEAVVGAAEIAAAFGDDWQSLGLFRVVPAGRRPGGRGGVEYAFALLTRGGTRIDWGLGPSTQVAGEPSTVEKIARLRKYAAAHGSLDGDRPQQLRFGETGELEAVARPAVKPLPKSQ